MRSAEHYRSQAARSRRLAKAAIDPDLQKQLETTAAEFDEMAAEIERQTNGKPPNSNDI
jgi:hypothetical protein